MTNQTSALHQLVDLKLGGAGLAHYLRQARAAGKPFHAMAYELMTKTGVTVTHETVRRWVRELEEADNAPPSVSPGHRRAS